MLAKVVVAASVPSELADSKSTDVETTAATVVDDPVSAVTALQAAVRGRLSRLATAASSHGAFVLPAATATDREEVILSGLQLNPELNGRRGLVVSEAKDGRIRVQVEGHASLLVLKPKHLRTVQDEQASTCIVCLQRLTLASSRVSRKRSQRDDDRILCRRGHTVCKVCLEQLVQLAAQRSPSELSPKEIESGKFRACCPLHGHGCSASHYDTGKQLAVVLHGTSGLAAFREARKSAMAHFEASVDYDDPAAQLKVMRRTFKRSNGTYAAYMCPQCGFGPVDHGFCSDLRTHQGDTMANRGALAPVRNNCPSCGLLLDHISAWKPWDGKSISLLSEEQALRHPPSALAARLGSLRFRLLSAPFRLPSPPFRLISLRFRLFAPRQPVARPTCTLAATQARSQAHSWAEQREQRERAARRVAHELQVDTATARQVVDRGIMGADVTVVSFETSETLVEDGAGPARPASIAWWRRLSRTR